MITLLGVIFVKRSGAVHVITLWSLAVERKKGRHFKRMAAN